MDVAENQDLDTLSPCLADALLGLYDCYLDPAKIIHLIHLLGSWLGEEENQSAIPNFETHSEKIWRLLTQHITGKINQDAPAPPPKDRFYIDKNWHALDGDRAGEDLGHHLNSEDLNRVKEWLRSEQNGPLLLRLYDEEAEKQTAPDLFPKLLLLFPLDTDAAVPEGAVAMAQPSQVVLSETLETLFADSFNITVAERAVLRRLVMGEKAPQIAEALGIKPDTVHTHIKNLGQKLGVSTQIEILATVRAVEASLRTDTTAPTPTQADQNLLDLGNGHKVEFATYGPADGRPVFYIHGFMAGRNLPETINSILAKQKTRLIAINRPGVGRSTLCGGDAQEHLKHTLVSMAKLMEHFGMLYMPMITDGSGLIYALEFMRQYPGRCTQILGLDPTPPVLQESDLNQFVGLFHKSMVANFNSRQIAQTLLQLAYEDGKNLTDANAFINWHIFRQEEKKLFSPSKADIEARWQNFQENMVNQFQHLIFDADLIKTDFVTFPDGSNLRSPITLFQTDDSAYIKPDAVGGLADKLSARLIHAGETQPYIEGQIAEILSMMQP